MATQVVSVEPDVANRHLSLMWVKRRVSLCETVTLQHVEHRGLSCVVETKEYNICTLLKEAKPLHGSSEEVDNEHFNLIIIYK